MDKHQLLLVFNFNRLRYSKYFININGEAQKFGVADHGVINCAGIWLRIWISALPLFSLPVICQSTNTCLSYNYTVHPSSTFVLIRIEWNTDRPAKLVQLVSSWSQFDFWRRKDCHYASWIRVCRLSMVYLGSK